MQVGSPFHEAGYKALLCMQTVSSHLSEISIISLGKDNIQANQSHLKKPSVGSTERAKHDTGNVATDKNNAFELTGTT